MHRQISPRPCRPAPARRPAAIRRLEVEELLAGTRRRRRRRWCRSPRRRPRAGRGGRCPSPPNAAAAGPTRSGMSLGMSPKATTSSGVTPVPRADQASPLALVTPAAEISTSASDDEWVASARPPTTSSTSSTKSSGAQVPVPGEQLDRRRRDQLVGRRRAATPGARRPSAAGRSPRAGTPAVLDGEPGVGLPPRAARVETSASSVGLRAGPRRAPRRSRGRARRRRCRRSPAPADDLAEPPQPAQRAAGDQHERDAAARQRSSSATVRGLSVSSSAAACRRCRWRSAAAASQTSTSAQ